MSGSRQKTELSIDPEKRRISIVHHGTINAENLIEFGRRLRAEPNYDPSFCALVDFRGARFEIDHQAMRQLLLFKKEQGHFVQGPIAHLTDNSADYGILRMHQTLAQDLGINIRIFETREGAEKWLEN